MPAYGAGLYGIGPYGVGSVPTPDDWGSLPGDPTVDRWDRAALQGGVRALSTLTVTVPGGEPVELTLTGLSVTQDLDAASRFVADAEVVREVGQDTWHLVTTPGARFEVHHGWVYGGGDQELRPFGVYELAAAPKSNRSETISLSLLDQWKRLEECRLTAPVVAAVGTSRVGLVQSAVAEAIPGVAFRGTANGGEVGAETTWDRDRTTMIQDLARDGGFLAYFDADGTFVIEPDPVMTTGAPVETFTEGPVAAIVDLSTEQVYARLYNGVVVTPQDGDDSGGTGTSTQTWSPVAVWISDPEHPRHPDKIGRRPAFYSSPTIANASFAYAAGRSLLRRYINALERIEVTTWARAHRRPGQTISTYQDATYTDAEATGVWLIEKNVHNLLTLETTITARSAAEVPTEEE